MFKRIGFLVILLMLNTTIVYASDENDSNINDAIVEENVYNKYFNGETLDSEISLNNESQFMYDNQIVSDSFVVDIMKDQIDRAVTSTVNGNSLTYTYKITNLQIKTPIQKSYIASNYLYFIQRGNSSISTTEGKKLYFSRVALGNSSLINASNAQMMTLNNFGHSQTLEYFDYDGTAYFWIGCNASDESMNWARHLGLVKFQAGKVYNNYTEIKRLTYLNKANSTGTSLGTTRRIEAALSSDQQFLLIWCRTYQIDENGDKHAYKTRYSIYDQDDVAVTLIESNSLDVSCGSNDIKSACLESFQYVPGDGSNVTLRMGSCQGLEINNSLQVFVASEIKDSNYTSGYHRHKYIFKLNCNGTILSTIEIIGSTLGVASQMELEGLQIKNSKLYITFADHAGANGTVGYTHYIYPLEFSVF